MELNHQKYTRREFIKTSAVAGAVMGLNGISAASSMEAIMPEAKGKSMIGVAFESHQKVRVGMIGIGGRGQSLLNDLLGCEGVEIAALCDLKEARIKEGTAKVVRDGQREPAAYSKNETDFENLCKRDDLDLIYIATPWEWHVPMAVFAMRHGKHVGVEVPSATTMRECWELVDTSEQTQKHCVILENCCYGYWEMLVLNMAREGMFGDLTHGEAAYLHDLCSVLFDESSEGAWRRAPHIKRNANLYPTHGLGPVANYMDINRGDRFETMVSMSSLEHSLTQHRERFTKPDDPRRKEKYLCGDMNTSLIKTAMGRTIMLQHDVVSPRPYSRINLISGTKGAFTDYPPRIFIEGQSKHDDWESPDRFRTQYEHKLWTNVGDMARKLGGHGGMDFIMTYRLIDCMKKGLVPDMDVYDAASWSAPTPLSEDSVKQGSAPQKFPDFTRGHWKEKRVGYLVK